jgi:hypothetical protein
MTQKLDDAYHRPILLDLVERLCEPVRSPIAYSEETSALYEADLVQPIIAGRHTDIRTAVERQSSLELHTANANLSRLKGMLNVISFYYSRL